MSFERSGSDAFGYFCMDAILDSLHPSIRSATTLPDKNYMHLNTTRFN